MFKKVKTTLACCSALMMLCAVPLNADAAEEVKINDAASVAVGTHLHIQCILLMHQKM